MLYSKNLLARYLSLRTDIQDIADTLTLKSCEVEEVTQRIIPHNVVIGKVLSVEKHPDADKLVVCQIDCWSKGTYQICTWAKNIVENSYVPTALPWCHLPAINLTIEPRKMRGLESNWMICSKEELGIWEDIWEHRIWTLQSALGLRTDSGNENNWSCGDMDDITDKDLGLQLTEKYPWLDGWIIDVENKTITHRPEMFGHFWLAGDLKAMFPDEVTFENISSHQEQLWTPGIFEILENATAAKTWISITTDDVLSYVLLEVLDVTVKKSDFYTRLLLTDIWIQPKNNRVDLSNLFMYITWQPVHFFDADKISWKVIVRNAEEWSTFTDLFGKEHRLVSWDIVIADETKVLALAGVVGSDSSWIDKSTKNILVEFGNFDAVAARKTWTRLGLRTDAEIRFEKYINPLYSLYSLTLFLDELNFFAKNQWTYTVGGISRRVNQQHDIQVLKRTTVQPERLIQIIHGTWTLSESDETAFLHEISELFASMWWKVSDSNGAWRVTVPWWISPDDMTNEADLIEEAARLRWYNNIWKVTYASPVTYTPFNDHVTFTRHAEDILAQQFKCSQLETYPWIHEKWHQYISGWTEHLFTMKNPLSPEQRYLRNTIIRSLVEIAEKNGPFFDTISVFDQWKVRSKVHWWHEKTVIWCLFWLKEKSTFENNQLLSMKGMIAELLWTSRITYVPTNYDHFHPVQQWTIQVDWKAIGSLWVLHPLILDQCKLPPHGQLVVCEIDFLSYVEIMKSSSTSWYESLQDQILWKDLSVLVPKSVWFGNVSAILLNIENITDVKVFDLYAWDGIPEDKKSIGVSLKISWKESLSSEQIQQTLQAWIEALQAEWIELRQ